MATVSDPDLKELKELVLSLDKRLSSLDQKVDSLDQKVNSLDQKLEIQKVKLDAINQSTSYSPKSSDCHFSTAALTPCSRFTLASCSNH